MKLAVITQDKNVTLLTKDKIIQLAQNSSTYYDQICIIEEKPNIETIKQLKENGFHIISLNELIQNHLLLSMPSFSDIMNRDENPINNNELADFYHNKIVFVTGGEGFVGSEIVSNILQLPVKKVIVYGHGENSASILCKKYSNDNRFQFVLGDIKDTHKLYQTMNTHRPDVIFHAAAHKHVPILELYPEEAIKTNIIGTVNMIEAARLSQVKHIVFVSTDKAVNPVSALGASKRIAEKICLAMDEFIPNMRITTVRFGNVFGSVGSVVPIFLEQIANNIPLTITDPSMIRYFMSVNEATRLVLLAATTEEGNLFSFDMGEPISIGELAERLYNYVGYEFDLTKMNIIGNRGGEKKSEELIYSFEEILTSKHNKLLVLKNTEAIWSYEQVKNICYELSYAIENDSRDHIFELLKKYIP